MMQKDEILPATMYVKGLAEVAFAHHRALDMPAGSAVTPWRFPPRFAGLMCFPEREVLRIVFIRLGIFTGTFKQLFGLLMG